MKKVDKKTPICELCTKSNEGCRCGEAGESGCEFNMMNKEDTVKALFIAHELAKADDGDKVYSPALRRAMMRKFYVAHDGILYDVAKYEFNHVLCPECEGAGVTVTDTISPCTKCNGIGVIEVPIDPDYNRYWMVYTVKKPPASGDLEILKLYHSENEAKIAANTKREYKYGPVLFHKRLGDAIRLFNQDDDLVAINVNNEIVTAGDWQTMHEYFGISDWQDIERFFDGTIRVYPRQEFKVQFEINTSEFMAKLYGHVISDVMTKYVYNASYEDAPELWVLYSKMFSTIAKVHDNIGKHLATEEPIMVLDDQLDTLNRICEDFRLIGMEINQNAAAHVIQLIQKMDVDAVTAITVFGYNAVAVFLTEYIIISAEYDTITD